MTYGIIDTFGGNNQEFVAPVLADVYPAGVTYNKLVPDSNTVLLGNPPSTGVVFEASARMDGLIGRPKVALFNLDTDTIVAGSELTFVADLVGNTQRSALLTLSAGTRYGVKMTTNDVDHSCAAFGCRLIRL